jgi:hypothetical protein
MTGRTRWEGVTFHLHIRVPVEVCGGAGKVEGLKGANIQQPIIKGWRGCRSGKSCIRGRILWFSNQKHSNSSVNFFLRDFK